MVKMFFDDQDGLNVFFDDQFKIHGLLTLKYIFSAWDPDTEKLKETMFDA